MDRLSELEAFVAVVDQGGFTGAAQKLNISKSAVSKHVSSLENRLGTRLLNRTTRRVNPTEIGLIYYERVLLALSAARDADAAVSTREGTPSGRIRVAAPTDFGHLVLSPLIGDFMRLHPDVEIVLRFTERAPDLESEAFDLGLHLAMGLSGGLSSRPLCEVTRHLVASPDYLAHHGRPERIEDLAHHRLLRSTEDDIATGWTIHTARGERRVIRQQGVLNANSGLCLRENALTGAGIAFLPDFVVGADLAAGRLLRVLPDLPPQTLQMHAVYPRHRLMLPSVRALLDHLVHTLAGRDDALGVTG